MKTIFAASLLIICSLTIQADVTESTCYGSAKQGRLENAVKLPDEGNNYTSYSTLAGILGRTYVHSKVYDVVISAYKMLETEQTNKVFKYAETGFKLGGEFKPHKTHQNGLSVDFMTPVLKNGKSVHLSTHAFNKFGYSIEFNQRGRYKDYRIDYDALAAHLVTLHQSAQKQGIGIWRVIFAPELQPNLYHTQYADYIRKNIKLSKKRSWVRHDEHYHVDFSVKCKPE